MPNSDEVLNSHEKWSALKGKVAEVLKLQFPEYSVRIDDEAITLSLDGIELVRVRKNLRTGSYHVKANSVKGVSPRSVYSEGFETTGEKLLSVISSQLGAR